MKALMLAAIAPVALVASPASAAVILEASGTVQPHERGYIDIRDFQLDIGTYTMTLVSNMEFIINHSFYNDRGFYTFYDANGVVNEDLSFVDYWSDERFEFDFVEPFVMTHTFTVNEPTVWDTMNGGTYYQFYTPTDLHIELENIDVDDNDQVGTYRFTLESVNAAGAVPEPSTWAMLILGFGLIGGAMRSRRRQSVQVSYV